MKYILIYQFHWYMDNNDWLEELLSDAGTTHCMNGIVIQKPFIGPKEAHKHAIITKSKRRSINVAPKQLPWYKCGTRPQQPVATKIQDQRYAFEWGNSLIKNLIWIICRFLKCSNHHNAACNNLSWIWRSRLGRHRH